MLAHWIKCLDKRPSDRTDEDLEVIYKKLKSVRLFRRIHPSVVQQLCFVAFIEHIDKGVILFRQGDEALNWYAVIYGSLDVQVSHTGKRKDVVTLCTLGIGTAFGDSVLNGGTHSVSVITGEPCTLLRVKRVDFQELWNKSSHLMEDIVSPLNCYDSKAQLKLQEWTQEDTKNSENNDSNHCSRKSSIVSLSSSIKENDVLSQSHRIGWVLRLVIMNSMPQLIRDRKYHLPTSTLYRKCIIGSELIDWILNITGSTQVKVHSRGQAAAMCQVLLEDKVLNQVTNDGNPNQFMDRYVFYRFCFDDQVIDPIISIDDKKAAESELHQSLATLAQLAPDAIFRLILRKAPQERTEEEIETVYEELLHIKALSHLSNSVKKELSSVIAFESHQKKGTVLFNQGDCGTCWYIILSGAVNVVIAGKGVVCTLHEGDDFGKLALVNDSPRAATIITSESNCQFLRVDKSHFDRILRDVEANTVRLKEHGREVLILQKVAGHQSCGESGGSHYKYMVMAGAPEKMLEHLLETRLDTINLDDKNGDTLLEDFLLTYPIFISWKSICNQLLRYYRIDELNARQEKEFIVANKRRVVHFMQYWFNISGEAFLRNAIVWSFIEDIMEALQRDIDKYKTLEDELIIIKAIIEAKSIFDLENDMRGVHKWKADNPGSVRRLSTANESNVNNTTDFQQFNNKWSSIRENDEIICRVFCADHTYTTLKISVGTKAETIKTQAAEKLGMEKFDELVLVELKSNAERLPFRDTELSIPTALTVNGRIFVSHIDHLDALTTLAEQEGPSQGTSAQLEEFSSQEFAYYLTLHGWQLFCNLHDYELIYHVFGRHNFNEITSNLDVFLRHFNEIQFWVITEIVLEKSLSRRVQLLRKFIKIAGHCKDYQNLNAFFAIIMGLSNVAVSRLTQTWERLPNKMKRIFSQYESLIDPSRNHRRYRIMVSKMLSPIIPFMPLLLKDITFAHEGNKTYIDQGLVNFEKMHMISQTLRIIRECKSGTINLEPPQQLLSQKKISFTQALLYIQEIKVIDCQRRLTQLSHSLEHRKI